MQTDEHPKVMTMNAPFNSATLHERKLYLYISQSPSVNFAAATEQRC